MSNACPVPTPEERARNAIVAEAEGVLLAKVQAALREADEGAAAALQARGEAEVAWLHGFFTARVHQMLYCLLCGADPETFEGGDPKAAAAIIRNAQNIARHYWAATIEAG